MSGQGSIGSPQKLSPDHDLSRFESGEAALDDWLRRRARRNEAAGASRTYVVCQEKRVVGYYTLAVGAGLLRDAVMRVVQAAEIAGIRAILVHAISVQARGFDQKYGFVESPVDPLTLLLGVAEAATMLARLRADR